MKFGIHGPADISGVERSVRAEQLGYEMASFGDSPMIWSDVFVTMAMVASATKKLSVGSGIAVAGIRSAPVIAAAAATVNQIAPGRVFLGLGTGATAYKLLGEDSPVKLGEFARTTRTLRALLDGEEVDYETAGKTHPIRFLETKHGYINIESRIPIYLAAMGPKGQELAGEIADGVFDGWGPIHQIGELKERLSAGARKSNRDLQGFPIWGESNIVILDPGEELTSDRVIDHAGTGVAIILHAMYDKFGRMPAERTPPFLAPFWNDYCSMMEAWPERTRHYRKFAGHGMYVHPEERRFIRPELIKMFSVVGPAEEIIERVRGWEAAGVTHVNINGTPHTIDEKMERFARLVMKKL